MVPLSSLFLLLVAYLTDRASAVLTAEKIINAFGAAEPIGLTPVDGQGVLYFNAKKGHWSGSHRLLWITNGTAEGTFDVRFLPGSGGVTPALPPVSTIPSRKDEQFLRDNGFGGVLDDRFFFFASDNADFISSRGLWSSDGTVEGTSLFKDGLGFIDYKSSSFIQLGGKLYFGASSDELGGYHVFRTDGWANGTVTVTPGTSLAEPRDYLVSDWGKLYFVSGDGVYEHDPTADPSNSTHLVEGTSGTAERLALILDGKLIYAAKDTGSNYWRTWRVLSVDAATSTADEEPIWISDENYTAPKLINALNGEVVVVAHKRTDFSTCSLLVTRIGEEGYETIKDFGEGWCPEYATTFPEQGKILYVVGAQIWVSDGTADRTKMLIDTYPEWTSYTIPDPVYFAMFRGLVYFVARSEKDPVTFSWYKLFVTDFTPEGTTAVVVENFIGGEELTVFEDSLYYLSGNLYKIVEDQAVEDITATPSQSPSLTSEQLGGNRLDNSTDNVFADGNTTSPSSAPSNGIENDGNATGSPTNSNATVNNASMTEVLSSGPTAEAPSAAPSVPSERPSGMPSSAPTELISSPPSQRPSSAPSYSTSDEPSFQSSVRPSSPPTNIPSLLPSVELTESGAAISSLLLRSDTLGWRTVYSCLVLASWVLDAV